MQAARCWYWTRCTRNARACMVKIRLGKVRQGGLSLLPSEAAPLFPLPAFLLPFHSPDSHRKPRRLAYIMDAEYRDSSPQIPIEGDGSTSEAPSSVSRDNASNGVEKMKEHSNEASARKRRRVKEELDDPAETTEEDCLRAEVRRLRARIQAIEKVRTLVFNRILQRLTGTIRRRMTSRNSKPSYLVTENESWTRP